MCEVMIMNEGASAQREHATLSTLSYYGLLSYETRRPEMNQNRETGE